VGAVGGAESGPSGVAVVKGASDLLTDLGAMIGSFGLDGGISNSLVAKLRNIRRSAESGQNGAACSLAGAFISEVQAQSGKGLTVAQANSLIAGAAGIRTMVCCSR
jgi:hypothetical protein